MEKDFDCGRFYSRRWEFIFIVFSGIAVVYTLRVNMSVAAQEMRDDLNWSENEKGLVLSAFYWGYSLGQIPASWFIQRYGAKWIFGFSVLIPSILTLLVPLAARSSFGLALVMRCLIGFFESPSFPAVYHFFPVWIPISEKTLMIPAIASGMYMGEIIGFSLSGAFIGWPLHINGEYWGGWPLVFYVFGLAGILWFPYFAFFLYESPDKHPYITPEEKEYIKAGKGYTSLKTLEEDSKYQNLLTMDKSPMIEYSYASPSIEGENPMYRYSFSSQKGEETEDPVTTVPLHDVEEVVTTPLHTQPQQQRTISLVTDEGDREEMAKRIPWYNFFTHPVALTLFINNWAYGFIGFTLLSEMPSYFTDVLGFDLSSAGYLCVFPYMALFFSSIAFGALFEHLQNHRDWSIYKVRQWAEYIAFIGSTGGLVICGFMDNKYAAYVFMILTQMLLGSAQVGLNCAYSDVAPNYSSALNSIGNTIGAIAGIVGPLVVAAFTTEYEGAWGWRYSFFLTAGLAAIALFFWSKYLVSEPVPALNMPASKRYN